MFSWNFICIICFLSPQILATKADDRCSQFESLCGYGHQLVECPAYDSDPNSYECYDACIKEDLNVLQYWCWNRLDNNETIINRLFAPFPNAMVAVPTGLVNGITVIDFDIRDSYNGVSNFIQEGFKIPKTAGAKTPSGGFHLYFDSGDELIPNSVSKLAIGVDVRGDGGYVIAPPSQSIKGTYKWETDWLDPKKSMAKLPLVIKSLMLNEQSSFKQNLRKP